jgi:hypothetical protein
LPIIEVLAEAEILTVAVIAAKYFNNNHKLTLSVPGQLHYLSRQLDPSRFNRRLHALADWSELILDCLVELLRTGQVFVIDGLFAS